MVNPTVRKNVCNKTYFVVLENIFLKKKRILLHKNQQNIFVHLTKLFSQCIPIFFCNYFSRFKKLFR